MMALTVTGAFAQMKRSPYSSRDYERRQSYQINELKREARDRISYGVQSRALTRREANRFMGEYERIQQRERQYRSRGGLSPRESQELVNSLERLVVNVRRETHDGRRSNDHLANRRYGPRSGY